MITDLRELLANMTPALEDTEYVFCSVSVEQRRALAVEPVFEFLESEGITVAITSAQAAQHGLSGQFPSQMITLRVYSSLHSVGFLAAITACLADRGISVQTVSAFHHDYLFVPTERAEEALEVLQAISAEERCQKLRYVINKRSKGPRLDT
jgi:hypothetical protein